MFMYFRLRRCTALYMGCKTQDKLNVDINANITTLGKLRIYFYQAILGVATVSGTLA